MAKRTDFNDRSITADVIDIEVTKTEKTEDRPVLNRTKTAKRPAPKRTGGNRALEPETKTNRAAPTRAETETEADRELRRFGIEVYQGDEAHKAAWDAIVKDEKAASMIRALCLGKEQNDKNSILIAPDRQGIGTYRFGYWKFILSAVETDETGTKRILETTVFAKSILRDEIEECVKTEEAEKERQAVAGKRQGGARSRKEKRKIKLNSMDAKRVFVFCSVTFCFLGFVVFTLCMKLYDFEGTEFRTVLINAFDEYILENFALLGALAACNYFGFLAVFCFSYDIEREAPMRRTIMKLIGFTLLYLISLSLILYLGWTVQSEELFGGDVEAWSNSPLGLYWIVAIVFAVVSVGGFAAIAVFELPDFFCLPYYLLVVVLFPIVFVSVIIMVIGAIFDKIPIGKFFGVNSGGSGSSSKTYEFTNSMGCTTTVTSDDGRDFYDAHTGSYVGSSSDGGQTIIEN